MRCYVLAGGRSRRMQRDKAALQYEGRSFLERVIDAAAGCDEIVLVGRADPSSGLRSVRDEPGLPAASISGVITALEDAGDERIWITAVDYPLLNQHVLQWLTARFAASSAPLLVPIFDQHPQMLCAGYSASVQRILRAMVAEGDYRLRHLLQRVAYEAVPESELRSRFGGEILRNVNRPADYEAIGGTEGE